ncbi:hypothetical protein OGAPHI_001164 [Ogataea philodendri]|uniref:Uncharacterized protein n=1 Tax=Ogataea philodendri TaxID=1378263 RepID=A0A9P8PG59_9ASCO|nr:uncharacterized protein OGAPHI_001164 [Ogataea philodendri]KAH3670649.1 hypothetical protein OGAPHI_001164 [Ogataea philodendri]
MVSALIHSADKTRLDEASGKYLGMYTFLRNSGSFWIYDEISSPLRFSISKFTSSVIFLVTYLTVGVNGMSNTHSQTFITNRYVARSTHICFVTASCWILTATSSPVNSFALCTCATDALATGVLSKDSNNRSL